MHSAFLVVVHVTGGGHNSCVEWNSAEVEWILPEKACGEYSVYVVMLASARQGKKGKKKARGTQAEKECTMIAQSGSTDQQIVRQASCILWWGKMQVPWRPYYLLVGSALALPGPVRLARH